MLALCRDHGECVMCARAGRYVRDRAGRLCRPRATMVHHIKPIKEHPELALSLDNLMSLCDQCHDEMHPEKLPARRKEQSLAERMGIKVEQL